MSDELCTSDQAIAAVGYFRHAFGGYALDPVEERVFLRAFRQFTAIEIRSAIDALVLVVGRRPSPNDVCAQIQKGRRETTKVQGPYLHETPPEEITPPDQIPDLMAQLRDPNSELRQVG